ncbi:MAG: hypothetical protein WBN92_12620 [Terriglobia bacterium]
MKWSRWVLPPKEFQKEIRECPEFHFSIGSTLQRLIQRSSRDPQFASVLALARQQLKTAET